VAKFENPGDVHGWTSSSLIDKPEPPSENLEVPDRPRLREFACLGRPVRIASNRGLPNDPRRGFEINGPGGVGHLLANWPQRDNQDADLRVTVNSL